MEELGAGQTFKSERPEIYQHLYRVLVHYTQIRLQMREEIPTHAESSHKKVTNLLLLVLIRPLRWSRRGVMRQPPREQRKIPANSFYLSVLLTRPALPGTTGLLRQSPGTKGYSTPKMAHNHFICSG